MFFLRQHIFNNKAETALLAAVLIFSGWFMVRGIDFGLPDLFHDDEHFIVENAVNVAGGEFHITWFSWPASLQIYTNAGAFSALNALHNLVTGAALSPAAWFDADHSDFYLLARLQTALYALGILVLIVLIGKTWKNVRVGISATALLGVSFILTRHAHFITPDVPLTFFVLLTTLAGLKIGETGQRRWYTLGAVALGFGMITKYNALFSGIALLAGHEHYYTWRVRNCHALHFVIAFVIAVTLASPFFWIELPTVIRDIRDVSGTEHVGRSALSLPSRIRFYGRSLSTGVGQIVSAPRLSNSSISLRGQNGRVFFLLSRRLHSSSAFPLSALHGSGGFCLSLRLLHSLRRRLFRTHSHTRQKNTSSRVE